MRTIHLVPPLVALVGSAVWIFNQQKPLNGLEKQTSILKQRISEVKSVNESSSASTHREVSDSKKSDENRFVLSDGSIDWKSIAKMLESSGIDSKEDARHMVKVQKMITEMDADELVANLERIRDLNLEEELRKSLRFPLILALAPKNPESAMTYFSDSLDEAYGPKADRIREIFGEWAMKDPAAAMVWMDKQIAEGNFDSKSLDPSENQRLAFEARLMGAIFYDDPDAVTKRLDQFSPREQNAILRNNEQWQRDGKVTKEYIELLRSKGLENLKTSLVGMAVAENVKRDGLESVSQAFRDFDLTPEERQHAIDDSISNYSDNWEGPDADLTKVYPWLAKEDPDRAVELTAKSLTNRVPFGGENIEQTFKSALEISSDSGRPEIMDAFMDTIRYRGDLEDFLKRFKNDTLRDQYKELYLQGAELEVAEDSEETR